MSVIYEFTFMVNEFVHLFMRKIINPDPWGVSWFENLLAQLGIGISIFLIFRLIRFLKSLIYF